MTSTGRGTTSSQPPGSPPGIRSGVESARTAPIRLEPAPVNYVEKAKTEMKRIEDIQTVLKQVEELQKNLSAANVKDKLAPVVEQLQRKLAVRKQNFQRYRSRIENDETVVK